MTQEGRVLKMLQKAGKNGIANHQFASAYIMSYTKVISNLRKEGNRIETVRVYSNGKATGTNRYVLEQKEKKRWWKK